MHDNITVIRTAKDRPAIQQALLDFNEGGALNMVLHFAIERNGCVDPVSTRDKQKLADFTAERRSLAGRLNRVLQAVLGRSK